MSIIYSLINKLIINAKEKRANKINKQSLENKGLHENWKYYIVKIYLIKNLEGYNEPCINTLGSFGKQGRGAQRDEKLN